MIKRTRSSSQRRPWGRRPALEVLGDRSLPSTTPFFFSTGNPDGRMATASRPANGAAFEIESADDFVLNTETQITSATFTGLVPSGATVNQVVVEIYRVFPKDSNTARTINVPTRTNSPSGVVFNGRDSAGGDLAFTTTTLAGSFTASNSVQPGGIHPLPNQTTGGNGPITGQEVRFNVTFTVPLDLPADPYFFVPQVLLSTGNFFWLSAPKPIVAPGTPFSPDLQSWTRDANLDPDWLRVGTDIVGGTTPPTFNAAFSLTGTSFTPAITALSRTSAAEGNPGFTLTVTGSDFTPGSTVLFNGAPLATTFVNSSTLTAAVPASALADEGTAIVSVADTQRGVSNPQTFTITESTPAVTASVSQDRSRFRATVSGAFSDQASEPHRVRIEWGDGTSDTLPFGAGTGIPFTISHRHSRKKFHRRVTIRVTAFDDEGTASNTLTFSVGVGR
jgi:hypothetical protein